MAGGNFVELKSIISREGKIERRKIIINLDEIAMIEEDKLGGELVTIRFKDTSGYGNFGCVVTSEDFQALIKPVLNLDKPTTE